jgi:hypothetical protein
VPLSSDAFSFYEHGSQLVGSNYPPARLDGLQPFVVRVSAQGLIPCNVLVFAADKAEARKRVLKSLVRSLTEHYRNQEGNPRPSRRPGCRPEQRPSLPMRGWQFLRALEHYVEHLGRMKVEVEEFDVRQICKIQWASNDSVNH